MELGVDALHILQVNLLLENHLVESANEKCVQEASVEDGEAYNTPNEFEVAEMLRVDARMGVDLQSVVVVCTVLEQTVEGVEHLVRKKEEKLSVMMLASYPFGARAVTYLDSPP